MAEKRRSDFDTPDAMNNLITRSVPVGIVLLEDSDDDVELIRKELARNDVNFRLRRVSTRAEFESALLTCPDLVLSDYWLPEISGEEALEICKRMCPATPFILLSGHLKEDTVIRALKLGAEDFIIKDRLARLGPAVQKALVESAERKRLSEVETALAGTEERFRTLFSAAPIGLAVLSISGQFQQVNSALARMLRFESGKWSGHTLFDFMSPKARDHFQVLVQHLTKTGNLEFHFEEQFITSDQHQLWAQVSVSRVASPGSAAYLIVTFTDVSREKQAARFEALLAKLDRSLNAASDYAQAGSVILDTVTDLMDCDGVWLYFSAGVEIPQQLVGVTGNKPDFHSANLSLSHDQWVQMKEMLSFPALDDKNPLGGFFPLKQETALLCVPIQISQTIKGFLAARTAPSEDQPQRLHDLSRIAVECSEALVRIQVTEELRESEKRYRTVCEAVPIGIFEAELSGDWTYTNARLRRILQEDGESFLGRSWFEKITPEEKGDVIKSWNAALASSTPWRTECRLVNEHGDLRWVQAFATSKTHRNEPLGRFIGTVEDITERRRAESVLLELANIVSHASDSIVGLSPEGTITSWNRGAEKTYGYTAYEILNKPVTMLIPVERKSEHPLTLLDAGNEVQDFETVRVRKDGKRINVSLTVSAVRDNKGKLVGASAITRDITERKRLEQEVLDAVTNEQRRIGHDLHDGLGQFLTGLAFRAKMIADTLQEKNWEEAADASQLVDLLNSATSQTRALARGLDPIAVEAQEIGFALTQLADQTELLMRVKCKVILPATRVNIFAFASLHLYRIAQESITNAVKHGNAKVIEIKLESNDEGIALQVKDNGCGFNPDQVRATGIGLRILQYRTRSIGGVLTITSAPEKGATVRCFVPSNQLLQEPKV